jgi:hypothetical protein
MTLEITFKCSKEFEGIVPEPVPSRLCYPKWISEMKSDQVKNKKCPLRLSPDNPYEISNSLKTGTLKSCPGIMDFLNHGYLIKSWSDFIFRETPDNGLYVNWVYPSFPIKYTCHPSHQFPGINSPPLYDSFHKIETPWIIKTSPGVSCMITHPVWHRNKSFTSATGIYHSDIVPLQLPWFFEWNYKISSGLELNEKFDVENQTVKYEEPLMMIIPFYRENFKSKIEYVDELEIDKLSHKCRRGLKPGLVETIYSKFRRTGKQIFK